MNTQPSSTSRTRRLPAVSAWAALRPLWFPLTLLFFFVVGVSRPAAAQSAYAMAWVFDGPGCRSTGIDAPSAGTHSRNPVEPIAPPPKPLQEPPQGACADDHLLQTLLDWLSTHLQQPKAQRLPRLEILDRSGLAARLCPGAAADCEGIMAAYDAPTDTVILRDFLDMRRAPDRSFLVHELIHVLQHQRQGQGFQARCSDVVNSEREAYQVQNRYLAAHGQLQRVGQMIGQMSCPREDGEPVIRVGRAPGAAGAVLSARSAGPAGSAGAAGSNNAVGAAP